MQDDHRESADKRIGSNLRNLRERADISQTALARQMTDRGFAWHQQTVTRIESGLQGLRAAELEALAAILRTSLDRFTWASPEANQTEMVYAARARLRKAYENTAEAVRRHIAEERIAARITARYEDSPYERVHEARDEVTAQLTECALEEAIEEGIRRAGETGEEDGDGDTQSES